MEGWGGQAARAGVESCAGGFVGEAQGAPVSLAQER